VAWSHVQPAGQTFEQIRERFDRQGYIWLARKPGDDLVIVGTFLR